MPYVNIKVTGGREAPSAEQKAELIAGVTDLLARVLNKNPETTVVPMLESICTQTTFSRDPSPCGINSWMVMLTLVIIVIALWYWENH